MASFADQDDNQLVLNLAFDRANGTVAAITELFRSVLPAVSTLLIHDGRSDRFELSGPGHISYRVGNYTYRIGHLSFFQVNRFLLVELLPPIISEDRANLPLHLF